MRPDMAKVIVERPRFGSRTRGTPKGSCRLLQRLGDENLPFREGIKRRTKGGTKSLNEHLGPLRRYLDSQVGRPWDKVFSEICANIDRASAVQDHVRDHVAKYVETHVVMIDGVPCHGEGFYYGYPLNRWAPWYVCPSSGLLKRIKPARRTPANRPPAPPAAPPFIRVSDTLQCRRIGGIWHLVELRPLPLKPLPRSGWDVLLDRPTTQISQELAREQYGANVYAAGMRPLGRKELGQFPIPAELW